MFFLFFYGYKLTITETEKRYKKKDTRKKRAVITGTYKETSLWN